MAVAMVQIRDVGMVVDQRRVAMGMRVRLGDRAGMDVAVMLVVNVQMVVLEFPMGMQVCVALARKQRRSNRH